jgi:hypothetical protein
MNGIRNTAQQTHPLSKRVMLALIGLALVTGCAGRPVTQPKTIYQSGLSEVRVEQDSDSTANSHPANLTATEVGTLLRGVRAWERRNVIHRLFVGEADRTRAFRNEEITVLAPPLAKALAQAGPDRTGVLPPEPCHGPGRRGNDDRLDLHQRARPAPHHQRGT